MRIAFLIFLFSAFLSLGFNFGQTDTSKFPQDSIKLNREFKLRLNNNPNAISPLFAIRQPMLFEDYSQFHILGFEQNISEKPISLIQLRREMNETLKIYRQGTIKNDLGFVGEILGYTNAAAAVGLAIYHVSKYSKKYGIK